MTPKVLLGILEPSITSQVLNRVRHPAFGFEYLDNCVDALELMARLETTEVDILIISSDLPNLSKSMIKFMIKQYKVLVISDTEYSKRLGKYPKQTVTIETLAQVLGSLRPLISNEGTNDVGELIVVLAVASSSGSSTVAINLGYARAAQTTVLLADFDFTHPSLLPRLTHQGAHSNLLRLASLLPDLSLTPAELSVNCIQLSDSLRLLAGIESARNGTDINLNLLDEVVDVALELDEVVVLDLGQRVFMSSLAKFQSQLLHRATRIVLVSSADPISLLTTCNWLSAEGSKFQSKLEVVLNRVEANDNKAELARLIQEAAGVTPQAFLPVDHKLHRQAIWAGRPASVLKPKSQFNKAISNWLNSKKLPEIKSEPRKKSVLERLKEVS